ncbi:NlpC/P60 family protein [Breznakiella homolactica]|uniref:C40 family peptidase n=1 Tax=Breznakiella homolactica TaxID=2798577 RepID=A0A7T7XPW8_9SPIR|nr:NlpC/P60 family protein [Breznakiella homolactica]QQO10213.1 C40 family peptidase [Breznakiella homolactica]
MIDVSDLIGRPYQENGRGDPGYDCYGIVIEVSRRFGFFLPDLLYNKETARSEDYITCLNLNLINTVFPGAILEMAYQERLHVGICINTKEFIHAVNSGVRINRIGSIEIRGIYGYR